MGGRTCYHARMTTDAEHLAQMHPWLRKRVEAAVADWRASAAEGDTIRIVESVRSTSTQAKYFAEGRSKADGVNRLSLGVQSLSERKLSLLERDHRRTDVERAVAAARRDELPPGVLEPEKGGGLEILVDPTIRVEGGEVIEAVTDDLGEINARKGRHGEVVHSLEKEQLRDEPLEPPALALDPLEGPGR